MTEAVSDRWITLLPLRGGEPVAVMSDGGRLDLGGWRESDDEIEIARLVVRDREIVLVSGDQETLDLVPRT